MKTRSKVVLYSLLLTLLSACADRQAEAKRAREEAEAKARAEATRKEMDSAPKTFKSRDIFKKNEPEKAATPAVEATATKK